MSDTRLVVAPDAALTDGQWHILREQAAVVVKSGFLPGRIKTAEQALTVMLTGRELGIPPMTAARTIAVVDGKPTIAAELMVAMIYRDHGDAALLPVESTAERATYRYKRRGWPEYQTFAFTIAEAKTAGLLGKSNWQNFPAAMLRARCVSAIARMAFPDTIGGMYTPEEINPDIRVSETQEPALGWPENGKPLLDGNDLPAAPENQEPPADGQFRDVPADAPATDEMRDQLKELMQQHDWESDDFNAWRRANQANSWSRLTVEQAGALAADIKMSRKPGAAKAAAPPAWPANTSPGTVDFEQFEADMAAAREDEVTS